MARHRTRLHYKKLVDKIIDWLNADIDKVNHNDNKDKRTSIVIRTTIRRIIRIIRRRIRRKIIIIGIIIRRRRGIIRIRIIIRRIRTTIRIIRIRIIIKRRRRRRRRILHDKILHNNST